MLMWDMSTDGKVRQKVRTGWAAALTPQLQISRKWCRTQTSTSLNLFLCSSLLFDSARIMSPSDGVQTNPQSLTDEIMSHSVSVTWMCRLIVIAQSTYQSVFKFSVVKERSALWFICRWWTVGSKIVWELWSDTPYLWYVIFVYWSLFLHTHTDTHRHTEHGTIHLSCPLIWAVWWHWGFTSSLVWFKPDVLLNSCWDDREQSNALWPLTSVF